jgi:hypothetical protein
MPIGTSYYVIPKVVYRTTNPTITDDTSTGIEVGQLWVNTATGSSFQCRDNTVGAAKWYGMVFQLDPTTNMVPDYQDEIDAAATSKNLFITPEIIYSGNPSITYDITIPTLASALSVGPITIEDGITVTVDGIWTVI